MLLFRDLASAGAKGCPPAGRVATVGCFDGLHVGHQKLLGDLNAWAGELGAQPTVVTFERHPQEVISGSAPLRILSLEHKLLLLQRQGIAVILVLPFDAAMARWSAERFVRSVLVEGLGAGHLLMGFDSAFGHGRRGTYEYFRAAGDDVAVEIRQASMACLGDERVSSTLVRNAIGAGDLPRLRALLGRPFSLLGTVVPGVGRGRTLGIPTANLDPGGAAVLPAGVYFATAGSPTGEQRHAVVNVGRRPTFGDGGDEGEEPVIEIHILDFEGDLYGEEMEVLFLRRHRDERKFPSVEALRAQIFADIETLRREERV